jgi:hypothetical protein
MSRCLELCAERRERLSLPESIIIEERALSWRASRLLVISGTLTLANTATTPLPNPLTFHDS